eukprot:NODE_427_length_1964_cov_27.286336_g420_i0.p1 GENE.NODE_427_length_1964_cov_27.286336_g420_i0~~NODE_427_length_1964_cov_27.286336_g420_i0.p1  ORF type:complete len:640 (-),score=125.95 NODE_427_length_1964_cov_27.286336_g420_i0:45-1853(-)
METDVLASGMYSDIFDCSARLISRRSGVLVPAAVRIMACLVEVSTPWQLPGFPVKRHRFARRSNSRTRRARQPFETSSEDSDPADVDGDDPAARVEEFDMTSLNDALWPTCWQEVEAEAVQYKPLSEPCAVFTFNFGRRPTPSGSAVELDVPADEDGTVHALMTWWEVLLHNGITVNTGPSSQYAQRLAPAWRQTLHTLDVNGLPVQAGDEIPVRVFNDNERTWAYCPKSSQTVVPVVPLAPANAALAARRKAFMGDETQSDAPSISDVDDASSAPAPPPASLPGSDDERSTAPGIHGTDAEVQSVSIRSDRSRSSEGTHHTHRSRDDRRRGERSGSGGDRERSRDSWRSRRASRDGDRRDRDRDRDRARDRERRGRSEEGRSTASRATSRSNGSRHSSDRRSRDSSRDRRDRDRPRSSDGHRDRHDDKRSSSSRDYRRRGRSGGRTSTTATQTTAVSTSAAAPSPLKKDINLELVNWFDNCIKTTASSDRARIAMEEKVEEWTIALQEQQFVFGLADLVQRESDVLVEIGVPRHLAPRWMDTARSKSPNQLLAYQAPGAVTDNSQRVRGLAKLRKLYYQLFGEPVHRRYGQEAAWQCGVLW